MCVLYNALCLASVVVLPGYLMLMMMSMMMISWWIDCRKTKQLIRWTRWIYFGSSQRQSVQRG